LEAGAFWAGGVLLPHPAATRANVTKTNRNNERVLLTLIFLLYIIKINIPNITEQRRGEFAVFGIKYIKKAKLRLQIAKSSSSIADSVVTKANIN